MYEKARVFGDGQSMLEILHAESPAEAKKIGRKVFPFQKEIWQRHRYAVLYEQVYNKFHQSPRLAEVLLKTGDRLIVEAADYDPIFGVGLSEYTSNLSRGCKLKGEVFDIEPKFWLGENLLGIAIIEVRATLKRFN